MNRRHFLALSAAGVANMALLSRIAAKTQIASQQADYNIIILGDTHYDTEPADVYHAKYVDHNESSNQVHRAEFVRNGEMWRSRCPKMLKRAAKLVDSHTRFVLQMGDLVQGDCGDPVIHEAMLGDAIHLIKKRVCKGLPFVTVVGNHDIRGTHAKECYHRFMPPVISQELGIPVADTSFKFSMGDDVFIVIDFNDPDATLFDRMLDDSKGARHTFIVSHGTIFPAVNTYPRWYLYGGQKKPANPELHKHFMERFAQRNAICLCGHTHLTEFLDWYGYDGHITQMTMNSVWAKEEYGTYRVLREGAGQYGLLSESEKARKAGTPELYAPFQPGVRQYSVSQAAGSYKLSVSPTSIAVDFHAGCAKKTSHRFLLR
ncbi:MAG: metallophosphoesterase [Bacteroidaceae bacterium]|nr:metallophosphoesterase [Bacteroidaceae bacterium]